MGNDTGLLGVASVRAPFSRALNCSLGARRFGSLPQPFKEVVDDITTRPILQPGCCFSSYVGGFSTLPTQILWECLDFGSVLPKSPPRRHGVAYLLFVTPLFYAWPTSSGFTALESKFNPGK